MDNLCFLVHNLKARFLELFQKRLKLVNNVIYTITKYNVYVHLYAAGLIWLTDTNLYTGYPDRGIQDNTDCRTAKVQSKEG